MPTENRAKVDRRSHPMLKGAFETPARRETAEVLEERILKIAAMGKSLSESMTQRASQMPGKEENVGGVRFHRYCAGVSPSVQVWLTLTPEEEARFFQEAPLKALYELIEGVPAEAANQESGKITKGIGMRMNVADETQFPSFPIEHFSFEIGPRFFLGGGGRIDIGFHSGTGAPLVRDFGVHNYPRLAEVKSALHSMRSSERWVPSQEAFEIAEASAGVFQDILAQRIPIA